jgi:hypothetical protein
MEEVGKILPAVFKAQMRRAEPPLVEFLTPLWPRVVGKAIAECTQPIAFAGGSLTLGCSCPSWTAQLRSMSEEIRTAINNFLGGAIVKKLSVRHVADLVPLQSAREKRPGRPARGAEKLRLPESAAKLDSEIFGIVERSFAKYFSRRGKGAS